LAIVYPGDTGSGFSAKTRGDFDHKYRAALRHSRRVRWLRIGVPVSLALVLLGVVGANYMASSASSSFTAPRSRCSSRG
jgi:hypothetical protein